MVGFWSFEDISARYLQ